MTTGNFLTRNQDTEFHFMVDIETLATSNNAAITEIGAVGYALAGTTDVVTFHKHCVDPQGERCPATIQWRLDNNLHWATDQDVNSPPYLSTVLKEFFAWIGEKAAGRRPILWCKETDFDAVILTNAAKQNFLFLEIPWKYNDINDVRTLLRLWPQFKVPRDQVKHNGLEDAIMQWTYLEKLADYVAHLELCAESYRA